MGDIIPPFSFGTNGSFAGLNWDDDGEKIFDDGCERDHSDHSNSSDDSVNASRASLPNTGGPSWLLLLGSALLSGLGLLFRKVDMGR